MATADERLENLDLTQEEMKNMTNMMKDPKFMKLFAEYANEMSDPSSRKEMENALKDAENRGERVPGFPSDKDLLIPTAAFCAKTKNEKTGAKVFINICYSDKIAKPKGREAKDKSGTAWEIPYSLGPAQSDKDKQGAVCEVHDFVVSTETHSMALTDRRFKNFLVETAIDAIQTQRRVQLSREFGLPKLKYKGQTKEPKMLTIPKGAYKQPPPPHPTPAKTGVKGPYQPTDERNDEKSLKAASQTKSSNEVEPKYKMTMQSIELKVTEQHIHLLVPGSYKLQLTLRYRVDEEKGQAKFDTSKHQLDITLPIIHSPAAVAAESLVSS
ncbi:hypothetical protein R1sor_021322 [Riccia sorocarpa]|uniref:PIH1 domain-containing protein 1 n=1 Tax=Riccia sorocarpa TaxID=122646 RepID=A0ABD3GI81_9MARC